MNSVHIVSIVVEIIHIMNSDAVNLTEIEDEK